MKKQHVTQETNWLYKQEDASYRHFTKEVALPDNADYWNECTNAEKEEWEHDHPQPEPEPEPKVEQ